MYKKYFFGAIIAAAVLLVNQLFIQFCFQQIKDDVYYINIAGRQRMLSQRINLVLYKLYEDSGSLPQLHTMYQLWQQTHHQLLNRPTSILPFSEYERTINALLDELTYSIKKMGKHTQAIQVSSSLLNEVNRNQDIFLAKMDEVVNLLERESERKLLFIIIIEVLLFLISLFIILLEIRYIFIPISRDLKLALTEAKNSTFKLRALYDSKNEATTFVDPDLVIQYNNKLAQEITQDIFGKPARVGDNSLDYILPRIRDEMNGLYRQVLDGQTIEFEETEDDQVWLFSLFPVYSDNKEIIGISHNVRDVSKLRKLASEKQYYEQQLKIIAENFPNGSVSLINRDLVIIYTNGSGYQKFGIKPEEFIGSSIKEAIGDKHFEILAENFDTALEGKPVKYQVEFAEQHFLCVLQPIFDDKDTVSNVVMIANEVTELINYQNKIINQNERLRRISWIQSHKVRGPLATLLGLINIISLENKDPSINKYLVYLKDTANILDDQIQEITAVTYKDLIV
ncbi:MAG: PAS domain-containing protein [Tunicatimonas sp.]|uniref:PAS domain-containing protein n=1 Tax=Tunicatimonas sp. TaxID=1940096 RepID=UPI003C70F174